MSPAAYFEGAFVKIIHIAFYGGIPNSEANEVGGVLYSIFTYRIMLKYIYFARLVF